MRISLVTTSFPLKEGADVGFPATWELARALKRLGHEVMVCTIGGAKQESELLEAEVGGIKVYAARFDDDARKTCFDGVHTFNVFGWQSARARLIARVFQPIIERFNPDVIECQEFNGLSFFLGAQRKHPLVVRCYGPMSLLMRAGNCGNFAKADTELVEGTEVAAVASADGLISICQDLASRFSVLSGRSRAEWDVIRAPFTVPDASPVPLTVENRDKPSIFFWGRVERQKGADLLVESFIRLSAKYPDLELVVAGQETTEDGASEPYANTMRARLAEAGLSERAHFRGFLSREEIARQAAESRVCVFASRYETCCYAALEAIAYGGAVVAAKAGGLPDYHEHGTSAYLVEVGSVDSLTAGIDALLADEALRAHLRQGARGFVARGCAPELIARQTLESYEKAIARFKHRSACAPAEGASYENAYKFLVNRLLDALDDQPIYTQFPVTEPPEVSSSVQKLLRGAARATKRIIAGRRHGDR